MTDGGEIPKTEVLESRANPWRGDLSQLESPLPHRPSLNYSPRLQGTTGYKKPALSYLKAYHITPVHSWESKVFRALPLSTSWRYLLCWVCGHSGTWQCFWGCGIVQIDSDLCRWAHWGPGTCCHWGWRTPLAAPSLKLEVLAPPQTDF